MTNRFGVTRALTQQLLLQELCEQNPDSKQKLQEYISKLMNNNKPQNNGLAAATDSESNPQLDSSERKGASPSLGGSSSLAALSPGNHSQASPLSASPVSCTTPSGPPQGGGPHLIPPPHSTISPVSISQMNGGGATSLPPPSSPTSSIMTSPSPLNKLQSMHPFDYRKLEQHAQRKTPEMPRSSSSSSSIEKPLPPSLSPMRFPPPPSHGLGPPGYPMPPNFGLHHPGKDTW